MLDIPQEIHADLLRTYWDTMLLRDIIEAHPNENINISVLRFFTDALVTRIGCPMTVSQLATNIKNAGFAFSKDTLYRYLSYLSDAYMIQTVSFFSDSEKVRARNYKKVYCIDWALAHSVSRGAGTDETRALENMVFIELKRRGYNISYYKSREGYEIDFVVTNNHKQIELLQVTFSLAKESVKKRELRILQSTADFFQTKSVKIITFNEENEIRTDELTIEIIPAWKWMLTN